MATEPATPVRKPRTSRAKVAVDPVERAIDNAVLRVDSELRRDMSALALSVREEAQQNRGALERLSIERREDELKTRETAQRLHERLDEISGGVKAVQQAQAALAAQFLEAATRTAEFDEAVQFYGQLKEGDRREELIGAVDFWVEIQTRYRSAWLWLRRSVGAVFVALAIYALQNIWSGGHL